MAYIDLMSKLHNSTQRDYLARVNDPDFPKAPASVKANLFLKRLVHVHPVKLETIVKLYKNRRSSESGGIK